MHSLSSSKGRVESCRAAIIIITMGMILFSFFAGVDMARAQEATPTSITLTWTAPGDDADVGEAEEYDIRYSQSVLTDANWNSAVQVANEPHPKSAGQSETFTVTGLQPSTDYYFGIKTADEVYNWSPLSNVVLRRTLDEATPPDEISNLNAVSSTSESVVLAWTAPGDDGGSGTASAYDIRYATSPISDLNWNSASQVSGEPSPQIAGSSESYTVTGLDPGTTYYFAIKTADEVPNWSGLSNIATRATDDEQNPPATIADLTVSDAAPNSITLTWTAPGDDGTTGTASEYDIRYSTSPISQANWNAAVQVSGEPSPEASGSNESFTVTGLNPGTVYYFAVKTADEVPNWSALSNVASGSTVDNIPPSAIEDLAVLLSEEKDIWYVLVLA